jgi:hypothetical protein
VPDPHEPRGHNGQESETCEKGLEAEGRDTEARDAQVSDAQRAGSINRDT